MYKKLLLVISIFCLAACAGMTKQKDEAAINQIKKVAVISFAETQPANPKISLSLNSGTLGAGAGGSMLPENSQHTDEMYFDLTKQIAANMNWSVLDPKVMVQHPAYIKAYKKTMEGWQNKMPPGKGDNLYLVKGIMDADCARILDQSGRDELMDALKVDALVAPRVSVQLHGTSVMGIGARHPITTVTLFVYKRGQEKHIWMESFEGDEQESVGSTNFVDQTLLSSLATKSAKTAFLKIGK